MSKVASERRRSGANRKKAETFTEGDLEHLEGTLRAQKQIGAYPQPVKRLLELANMSESLADALVATLGRGGKASKRLLSSAKNNATGEAAKAALVIFPEDLDVIASSPGLLLQCLKLATKPGTQLFTIAELTAGLASKFGDRSRKAWMGSLESDQLPREVGVLRRRKIAYLLLMDQIPRHDALQRPVLDHGAKNQTSHDQREQRDQSAAESELSPQILSVFDRLDRDAGGHNYVTLAALRDAFPQTPRQEIDDAIHALRRAKHITLDSADGRHARLSEAEIAAGILESGQRLVYVARRLP